jgi:hypothetical protein
MIMDETFQKVEQHLRKMLPPGKRATPITPETGLYRDLGMYGDVLAFDLVLWAHREFGVEGSFRLADYAPGEMTVFCRLAAKLFGKRKRQYESLTVRGVVTAIETKQWPD